MSSSRMSVRLLLKGRTGFYQMIENFNSEQISSFMFNFSHTVKLLSIIHPDFQNVNIVHQHNIQYVLLPVGAFRRMESPMQKAHKINQNHVKNLSTPFKYLSLKRHLASCLFKDMFNFTFIQLQLWHLHSQCDWGIQLSVQNAVMHRSIRTCDIMTLCDNYRCDAMASNQPMTIQKESLAG